MTKLPILQLFIVFLFQSVTAQFIITNPIPDTVCQGESALFQVMVSPVPDSLRWQYADTPNGPWSPPSIGTDRLDTTLIHVFNTQFYDQKFFRVVVWDEGMIADSSESAALTVNPLPDAEITSSGPTTFCQGNSVALTASPANSYAWSNGETIQSINVSIQANYSVTVTDLNGCSSSSLPTTVIVNSLPIAEISSSGPTIFCQGNSVILTASSAISYAWNNDSTVQSITVLDSGNYWVTVTGMNGCSATSAPILVNVNPLPVATISTSGPTTFCQGNSVVLTASAANSYAWNISSTMQSITVLDSGNYWVIITDLNGCSSSSSPTTVIVNPNPIADFTTMPDSLPSSSIDVEQDIYFTDNSLAGSVESPISKWKWNFGLSAEPVTSDSPGPNEVKYLQGGDKKVVLEVTDIKGCINTDSIRFSVNSDSLPSIQMTLIQQAICLGDKMIIEVSVKTLDKANYKVLPLIELNINNGSGLISLLNIITSNDEIYTAQYCIVFDQVGSPEITAKGFQQHKSTNIIVSNEVTREFSSGSSVPHVLAIIPSETFLCRGDLISFDIFISPMENADINYTINNIAMPLGQAINGYLRIENIPASIGLDQIVLIIDYIDLNNGCKNDTLTDTLKIDVRSKPNLIVSDTTLACMGKPSTLVASGADSYAWRDQLGQVVSTSSDLSVPTDFIQNLAYEVTGTTKGCSTVDTAFVEVVAPPSPSISGDTMVCNGQRVIYRSNSISGNLWSVNGGEIDGDSTSQLVIITWNTSGSVRLKQEVGGCDAATTRNVTVSTEESPPANDLVYLTGGGILLYPNPDLIPDLCYKWYLGDSLIDTFQGCVVGMEKSDEELSMYKVKVYYCNKSEECAQVLSYRSNEVEPEITDFALKVVPNPNDGVFALEYEIPMVGKYVQCIFNSSGQLILKEKVAMDLKSGRLDFSLPDAVSGLYFIKLINSATGEYLVVPLSILH